MTMLYEPYLTPWMRQRRYNRNARLPQIRQPSYLRYNWGGGAPSTTQTVDGGGGSFLSSAMDIGGTLLGGGSGILDFGSIFGPEDIILSMTGSSIPAAGTIGGLGNLALGLTSPIFGGAGMGGGLVGTGAGAGAGLSALGYGIPGLAAVMGMAYLGGAFDPDPQRLGFGGDIAINPDGTLGPLNLMDVSNYGATAPDAWRGDADQIYSALADAVSHQSIGAADLPAIGIGVGADSDIGLDNPAYNLVFYSHPMGGPELPRAPGVPDYLTWDARSLDEMLAMIANTSLPTFGPTPASAPLSAFETR